MPVKPIPEGLCGVTPYLFLKDAASFMDVAQRAFDAQERVKMLDDKGEVGTP